MVAHVKTITDGLRIFGPARPNCWGEIVWGSDNWGYGSNTKQLTIQKRMVHTVFCDSTVAPRVTKLLGNVFFTTTSVGKHQFVVRESSLAVSNTVAIAPFKYLGNNITFDSTNGFTATRSIGNSIILDGDIPYLYKKDDGYFYEFPGAGTNASIIYIPSYSSSTTTTQTWTAESTSAPIWG